MEYKQNADVIPKPGVSTDDERAQDHSLGSSSLEIDLDGSAEYVVFKPTNALAQLRALMVRTSVNLDEPR
jgi:hypothetical protein